MKLTQLSEHKRNIAVIVLSWAHWAFIIIIIIITSECVSGPDDLDLFTFSSYIIYFYIYSSHIPAAVSLQASCKSLFNCSIRHPAGHLGWNRLKYDIAPYIKQPMQVCSMPLENSSLSLWLWFVAHAQKTAQTSKVAKNKGHWPLPVNCKSLHLSKSLLKVDTQVNSLPAAI